MRLRIIVIVDPLSSQGIVDLLLFSPYSIDAPGEIFLTLSLIKTIIQISQWHHNVSYCQLKTITIHLQLKKAMDLYQDFNLFLVAALYQKY